MSERRNIYLFYALSAVTNFWFISSNWIYFWTRYMTFGQLGWIDAVAFGFGLLLEIPSGAIADLLGKRKTILFGMVAGALGVGLITFSGSLVGVLIGGIVVQICYAFYSGAGEALAYDTLVDLNDEKNFDHIITRSHEIENYTTAVVTFLGGLIFVYNFRLPHILWGSGYVLGIVLAYLLIEPKTDSEKFSIKKYFVQLGVGLREITTVGLRKYIGFFFVLVGVYYLYSFGFIRPALATSFGFFAREQGVILPFLTITCALIVRTIPVLRKKFTDMNFLVLLSGLMAGGFIMASFHIGYWGIVAMILIAIAGKLASPWISIIVNKNISAQNRATTLSTVALMTKVPYVFVAVLAGGMVERGELAVFSLWMGIIIAVVAVGSYLFSRMEA